VTVSNQVDETAISEPPNVVCSSSSPEAFFARIAERSDAPTAFAGA